MFIVQHNSGLYFHNKGRIILFESQEEVQYFMKLFEQYSMYQLAQSGDPMAMMQAPMVLRSECVIKPLDFDLNEIECGTVMARELLEKIEVK